MKLRREYRLRAFVVLCFALSLVGVISIVSFLPAFLFATIEKQNALTELRLMNSTNNKSGITELQREMAFSQSLLGKLNDAPDRARISLIIESIVSDRGPVRLDVLREMSRSTSTVRMFVKGFAPKRDDLLAFKSRLLASNPGSTIDLPVSELAKSADLDFSIMVNIQTK